MDSTGVVAKRTIPDDPTRLRQFPGKIIQGRIFKLMIQFVGGAILIRNDQDDRFVGKTIFYIEMNVGIGRRRYNLMGLSLKQFVGIGAYIEREQDQHKHVDKVIKCKSFLIGYQHQENNRRE